jgi:hypothetical protein
MLLEIGLKTRRNCFRFTGQEGARVFENQKPNGNRNGP